MENHRSSHREHTSSDAPVFVYPQAVIHGLDNVPQARADKRGHVGDLQVGVERPVLD